MRFILVFAACLCFATAVLAADNHPSTAVQVAPPQLADSYKAITQVEPKAPEQKTEQKAEPKNDPPPPAPVADVVTNVLPKISLDSAGVNDPKSSLGINMWQTTSHGMAVRLISGLPNEIISPSLRNMATRLLIGGAQPPQKDPAMELSDRSLLHQRLAKLWAMGDFIDYKILLAVLPSSAIEGELVKNLVLADLLAGNKDSACDRSEKNSRSDNSDLFWHEMQIYCALVSGNNDLARLKFDLLREKFDSTDKNFITLVESSLNGKKKTDVAAKNLQSLDWLIAKHSAVNLDVTGLDQIRDPLALAIAMDAPQLDWKKKVEIAERLALNGVISGEKLNAVYSQVPVVAKDKAELLRKQDPKMTASQRRAINWLNTSALADDTQRATAVTDLFDAFDSEQDRRLLAITQSAWLQTLTLRVEPQWFSPTAARLLILLGNTELSKKWLEASLSNNDTAAKIWPYLRLFRLDDKKIASLRPIAEKWAAMTLLSNPSLLEDRLGLIALLVRATGDSEEVFDRKLLPKSFSSNMLTLQSRQTASPALSVVLQQAVQNNAKAEAVLIMIYGLAQSPLAQISPLNLAQAVDSLQHLGLTAEAKQLVAEIFVISGL